MHSSIPRGTALSLTHQAKNAPILTLPAVVRIEFRLPSNDTCRFCRIVISLQCKSQQKSNKNFFVARRCNGLCMLEYHQCTMHNAVDGCWLISLLTGCQRFTSARHQCSDPAVVVSRRAVRYSSAPSLSLSTPLCSPLPLPIRPVPPIDTSSSLGASRALMDHHSAVTRGLSGAAGGFAGPGDTRQRAWRDV